MKRLSRSKIIGRVVALSGGQGQDGDAHPPEREEQSSRTKHRVVRPGPSSPGGSKGEDKLQIPFPKLLTGVKIGRYALAASSSLPIEKEPGSIFNSLISSSSRF